MTTVRYAREADRIPEQVQSRPLDLTRLEGDWTSATMLAGGIARMRTRQRDGSLLVRALGQGEPRAGGWGETRADSIFSNGIQSRIGHAFIATFENDQVRSRVETYYALGVLTTHTFHRFLDRSGRRDYFTREFFVAATEREADWEDGNGSGAEFPPALLSGENDPKGLLGTWVCLDPAVKSIGTLECALADGELTVRAQAAGADGPVDWGVTSTELFADGTYPESPPAFLATYDHGFMRMHLQARINRGILVVVQYAEFTDDSGRPDYFIRECYRR
jgi:hypothetical protein